MYGKRSIAVLLVLLLMIVMVFSMTASAYAVNWGKVAKTGGRFAVKRTAGGLILDPAAKWVLKKNGVTYPYDWMPWWAGVSIAHSK